MQRGAYDHVSRCTIYFICYLLEDIAGTESAPDWSFTFIQDARQLSTQAVPSNLRHSGNTKLQSQILDSDYLNQDCSGTHRYAVKRGQKFGELPWNF